MFSTNLIFQGQITGHNQKICSLQGNSLSLKLRLRWRGRLKPFPLVYISSFPGSIVDFAGHHIFQKLLAKEWDVPNAFLEVNLIVHFPLRIPQTLVVSNRFQFIIAYYAIWFTEYFSPNPFRDLHRWISSMTTAFKESSCDKSFIVIR